MFTSFIRMHASVLMAYLLATVLSALPLAGTAQPTAAEHDRMMSMAGHAAAMTKMNDSQSDMAQALLCQQHCRVATATLPLAERPRVRQEHASSSLPGPAPMAVSLSLPPPGPPPKVALI
ncbi:MAG TPA: hypothetical protein PLI43_16055 [Albidovulum sp.]|uniref:hypothetical protein n=1 Tax=Albidovulum sp. TaxID=1872424 RepID=UPI002B6A8116|nr:hypothetical protein [Albidovulum sp.]